MLHKFIRSPDVLELAEPHLRDDRANLSGGRRDTMRRGAIAGWEHLSRYDKHSRVWPKIREEISEAVEEDKGLRRSRRGGQLVVSKPYNLKTFSIDDRFHGVGML